MQGAQRRARPRSDPASVPPGCPGDFYTATPGQPGMPATSSPRTCAPCRSPAGRSGRWKGRSRWGRWPSCEYFVGAAGPRRGKGPAAAPWAIARALGYRRPPNGPVRATAFFFVILAAPRLGSRQVRRLHRRRRGPLRRLRPSRTWGCGGWAPASLGQDHAAGRAMGPSFVPQASVRPPRFWTVSRPAAVSALQCHIAPASGRRGNDCHHGS